MSTTKKKADSSSRRIDELSKPKAMSTAKTPSPKAPSPDQNSDLSDKRLPPPPTITYNIFKNGHANHKSKPLKIFQRDYHTLADLFTGMTAAGVADYGTSKLFTLDGEPIRQMGQLEDKGSYVAAVNEFVPGDYGKSAGAKRSSSKKPAAEGATQHASNRLFADAKSTQGKRVKESGDKKTDSPPPAKTTPTEKRHTSVQPPHAKAEAKPRNRSVSQTNSKKEKVIGEYIGNSHLQKPPAGQSPMKKKSESKHRSPSPTKPPDVKKIKAKPHKKTEPVHFTDPSDGLVEPVKNGVKKRLKSPPPKKAEKEEKKPTKKKTAGEKSKKKEEAEKKELKCSQCGRVFDTPGRLSIHEHNAHKEDAAPTDSDSHDHGSVKSGHSAHKAKSPHSGSGSRGSVHSASPDHHKPPGSAKSTKGHDEHKRQHSGERSASALSNKSDDEHHDEHDEHNDGHHDGHHEDKPPTRASRAPSAKSRPGTSKSTKSTKGHKDEQHDKSGSEEDEGHDDEHHSDHDKHHDDHHDHHHEDRDDDEDDDNHEDHHHEHK